MNLTNKTVKTLAIDLNGYVFAGTAYDGIFRSTDEGKNWIQINKDLTFEIIQQIVIDSLNNIFAGTAGGGIYISSNEGNNWTQINEGLNYLRPIISLLFINSKDEIFSATGQKINLSQMTAMSGNFLMKVYLRMCMLILLQKIFLSRCMLQHLGAFIFYHLILISGFELI